MCLTIPGRITRLHGALAEVEQEGRVTNCNALSQPDAHVGDYVLTHANLIVAIISADEAAEMIEAARELQQLLDAEDAKDAETDAFRSAGDELASSHHEKG